MITIIMPYYNNPTMLSLHYAEWGSWDWDLLREFQFVIVDDGSQEEPASKVTPSANLGDRLSIYRITEDRPWHQHAARNLGAHVAEDDWLLVTDMDHLLESHAAQTLVGLSEVIDPHHAYMLNRIDADTRMATRHEDGSLKPHPNSFLLKRNVYWNVGGYDENYCGIYGTDSKFRERLPLSPRRVSVLARYHRQIIHDASTRTLERKGDPTRNARKKAVAAANLPPKILDFPWEKVC